MWLIQINVTFLMWPLQNLKFHISIGQHRVQRISRRAGAGCAMTKAVVVSVTEKGTSERSGLGNDVSLLPACYV